MEFPAEPNQPGYDLLVDGKPFQVKTTVNPELIGEHLDRHPDVPVITNVENKAYAAERAGVYVDHALSHAQTKEDVVNTIHALDHIDAFSIHLPIITMLVSSVREGGLLLRGDTDPATAAKHVLMDAAGVGGGAAVGKMLAAAAIGSATGPAGAAIGGAIGAILGGVFGRKITNLFKRRPFELARERYAEKLREMGVELSRCSKKFLKEARKKYGLALHRWSNISILEAYFFPKLRTAVTKGLCQYWHELTKTVEEELPKFNKLPPEQRAQLFLEGKWQYTTMSPKLTQTQV